MPEFSIFSSDQPSLKRSSGESSLFFTSTFPSITMQWKDPSIVHTRFTCSSSFSARSILLRRGGGVKSSLTNVFLWWSMLRSVFFFFMRAVFVSRRTNLTMMGRSFIERDFCRRWLIQMSRSSMWTPMSLAMAITTPLVFSSAVSGTSCRRTFSRRLYWARRSSSNACDCRAERRWPTSLVRRSFSAAMLASSWGRIASMAVATAALMVLSNRGVISTITALTMSRTTTPVVEMGGRICSGSPLRRSGVAVNFFRP